MYLSSTSLANLGLIERTDGTDKAILVAHMVPGAQRKCRERERLGLTLFFIPFKYNLIVHATNVLIGKRRADV